MELTGDQTNEKNSDKRQKPNGKRKQSNARSNSWVLTQGLIYR